MRNWGLAIWAAIALSGNAWADDTVIYSDSKTAACVEAAADADEEQACIGLSSDACQQASDDGATTYGVMECHERETAFWDARLNAAYQALMARAKAADRVNKDDPRVTESIVTGLRDMQRAWIAYRDGRCAYEYSQWQGGTIAGPVAGHCMLKVTAEQAIYLEHSWPTY